jgi:hypothetical protein
MYSGMNVFLAERVYLYIRAEMKQCKEKSHLLKVSLSSGLLMTSGSHRIAWSPHAQIASTPHSQIQLRPCSKCHQKILDRWHLLR